MKPLIFSILLVLGVIVIVGLGSVLLVLWAYVAGQVMLRILPGDTFSAFEATLLNLVGVLIVGMLVMRIVSSATANPLTPQTRSSAGKNIDQSDTENEYPGIPRWRQPSKKIDFSDAKPNDPCPCGSGRKYKDCHGYIQASNED